MAVLHAMGELKKLQRTSWRFQRTFHSPLDDLERFVTTIATAHPDMSSAVLTVESVVFEAKCPPSFVSRDAWRAIASGATFEADSHASARSLLAAGLSDWLDFFFVPQPKAFVIYADHDEYCTFYANSLSNLNRVCDTLSAAGFHVVDGYERKA